MMGRKGRCLYKRLQISLVDVIVTSPCAIKLVPFSEPYIWLWSPAVLQSVFCRLIHGIPTPFLQRGLSVPSSWEDGLLG